jgi:hypothetical protein
MENDDLDRCPAQPIRRRGEEKRPDLNCDRSCKGYVLSILAWDAQLRAIIINHKRRG